MTIQRARHGDIELAYEVIGPAAAEPLLLVPGIAQMLAWHDDLCAALVQRGFRVVRFDNRDVGLSTHLHDAGRPSKLALALRPGRAAPYRLTDLAGDAVAVLDALGWRSAHLVGMGQGGMTAQTVAARHPDRVRSLTSISASPSPRIGRPAARTVLGMLRAARHPATTPDEYAGHLVAVQPLIGSPGYPADLDWLRDLGHHAFQRGHDQAGVERLSAAFQSSGDRRAELSGVRAPTVVLHGDDDPVVRPEGGRATAAAVPGARLVTYPGLGHELPRALWPAVLDEIVEVSRRAGAGRDSGAA